MFQMTRKTSIYLTALIFSLIVTLSALAEDANPQFENLVRVGDCVNVEQAGSGTANVRRVSEALCDAVFSNQVDEEMQAYMNRGADMCLQAKERMMDAETDEAFETAMRRVQFLCDD